MDEEEIKLKLQMLRRMQHDAVVTELVALRNLRTARQRQEQFIAAHVSRLTDLLLDMELLTEEDMDVLT